MMNLKLNNTSQLPTSRQLSPALRQWTDYIEKTIGFVLPKAQENWLQTAIITLADKLQLSTMDLHARLHEPAIRLALIDAVLIAESRFFRDYNALQVIGDIYTAHLQQESNQPFMLMSIGVAGGQEVWSAAMVLESRRQAFAKVNGGQPLAAKLIGVDANRRALAQAVSGRYPLKDAEQLPELYRHYVTCSHDALLIEQSLHSNACFVACNVFSSGDMVQVLQEFYGKVQVLICQNMLIYFRKFDQRDMLSRFTQLLAAKGYLLLGAGEGMFWRADNMQRVDNVCNLWQKY